MLACSLLPALQDASPAVEVDVDGNTGAGPAVSSVRLLQNPGRASKGSQAFHGDTRGAGAQLR